MTRSHPMRTGMLLGALLWSGTVGAAQEAGETVVKRGTIERDFYVAGGTIDIRADARGDVVAAGGRILIEERVAADVLAAGGTVDIGAEVLDDVRAAGGTVLLRGPIRGDAIAAAGTVLLTPEAVVDERAWLMGGSVEVAGRVGTHLVARAGRITISGTIDGDVDLAGDEIIVAATARIAGDLKYQSPRPARIDPAAQIGGGITHVPAARPPLGARVGARLLFIAALGLLGAVLIVIFPRFAGATGNTVRHEPLKALGLGVAVLIGTPVAAIVLMVTVVGVALGVAVAVAFGLTLVVAVLAGALTLGEVALGAARRTASVTAGERVAALLVGLLALTLLGLVPVVGGLLWLAALVFGLGGLQLTAYRAWRSARAGEMAASV